MTAYLAPSAIEYLPAAVGVVADRWNLRRVADAEMRSFGVSYRNYKILLGEIGAQRVPEFVADMIVHPAWQMTGDYIWRLADLASIRIYPDDGLIWLICDRCACDDAWREEQAA